MANQNKGNLAVVPNSNEPIIDESDAAVDPSEATEPTVDNTAVASEPTAKPTTPAAAPVSIQDQSDRLEGEIMFAEVELDSLNTSISKLSNDPRPAMQTILANATKRRDGIVEAIAKKKEQFAALATRIANAAVFDPFFAAVGEIAIPAELSKLEVKLPASLQIADVDTRLQSAQLAVAILTPISVAAKAHLTDLPRDAWDSMPALHIATSEDGKSVSVKFASGRTRSASDADAGAGKGKPATYRVISTPEDDGTGQPYSGSGKAGDMFGAGTENADQKAYATSVEPIRFPQYVTKRQETGGRVSPFHALNALGWSVQKISADAEPATAATPAS